MQVMDHILKPMHIGFGSSVFMLHPEILSIGCKCFIQREVGPGFTSDHITEPVMEQFMRYDIFMGLIQVLPISHVHLIKEYGGSGVFHRSGAKIPHDALGVLEIGRASCRERVCKYV